MAEIDKTYHNLLNDIISEGVKRPDPNRKGVYRIQIPDAKIIHDFTDGFPAITTKKLYWKGVVGELLWFLRGDTSIKYLVDNGINIWNKDAYNYFKKQKYPHSSGLNEFELEDFIIAIKNGHYKEFSLGKLGRVYGAQWRKWGKYVDKKDLDIGLDYVQKKYTDQISNLIKGLKENPLGTKHIVTAWNPAELDDMALPPCHWSFEILVEPLSIKEQSDTALNLAIKEAKKTGKADINKAYHNHPKYQFTLKWHQRSVDSFLGKM